jgi:hypothetical protein
VRAVLPAILPAILLAILLAGLPPGRPAGAVERAAAHGAITGGWDFRAAPRPAAPARTLPDEAACIAAILDAERDFAIGGNLLLAMGFTEAGRDVAGLATVWPWTVNADGVGRFFASRDEAVAHVRDLQGRGVRSIDVGCLQVNLRWHPDAFADLDAAFDPVANARYAARYLAGLGRAQGGAEAAVGRYHSARAELADAYRARVEKNRRWVAGALDYVAALAGGPASPAWGRPDRARLAFLTSLYADAPARPLLPDYEGR